MNLQNQRIGYIDRLKGMTILTVVVGHLYLLCYKNTDALLFKRIAAFHMYLFLFLSEMVITFFGKDSLDIYLWHFVILYNINLSVIYNWSIDTGNMYLEILLAVVLSIVVAATCVYCGKFIKQSSWIRNIAHGDIA